MLEVIFLGAGLTGLLTVMYVDAAHRVRDARQRIH